MSYLTINSDPAYWGQNVTKAEASRNSAKMAQIARQAGLREVDTTGGFPGVYDATNTEVFALDDGNEEGEIDWFSWYCSESKPGRTVEALTKMFKEDVLRQ